MTRASRCNTALSWRVSPGLFPYPDAVSEMERCADEIADGAQPELVWLLEHPPLYSAGTSAADEELISPTLFPVFETGRGGRLTYHGPGQRVVYALLDVRRRFGGDVRAFVHTLEAVIIDTLAAFDVAGERRAGRTGVWVSHSDANGSAHDAKIAAIGVRISRGISSHGFSINVAPDLAHYRGIVPCGISDAGVTSLAALGRDVPMSDVDGALRENFHRRFGARLAQ